MKTVTVEYAARRDMNYDKAFKPSIYVNGKWVYTISRCKKTMRGALNVAKRLAEQFVNENVNENMFEAIIKEKE